ncbi:hypothetical protein [Ehrlichia japonica]|uniref:Transmembrane protein n=1 Tax=Ehrlichia japonica TaxID=391036 RepID=X5H1L5_9RICK|nr:hypothetical protein [Ehrlichia japonica]AHX04744.1 hypothetical protein EHF_0247 [Ehrlichia japonica]
MLTGKFKWDAFINYEKSHIASFLKNLGFSDVEVLVFLCVQKSFHQNAASHLIFSKGKDCKVYSNKHIEFNLNAIDRRNYLPYLGISEKLGRGDILNLASEGQLWTTQMYALLRVCACAAQYILSGKSCTDEEIVEKLLDNVRQVSDCVMGHDAECQDSNELLENKSLEDFRRFSYVVLGEDHLTLPDMLASLVRYVRSQYSLTIQDLEETCSQHVLIRVVVLVIYKAAINQFVSINSGVLSDKCKVQIFPMLTKFMCDDTNKLPISCRNHLGIDEDSVLLIFYRDLFSVLHYGDVYDYYESENYLIAATVNDICTAVGRSLTVVVNPGEGYNPYYSYMTNFVFYDTMLAVSEVLKDSNLESTVLFEHVMLMYKTLLAEKSEDVLFHLFLTPLGIFRFCYDDEEGKTKVGVELVLELLFTCYHAAFIKGDFIDNVKIFFDKCYDKLCTIGASVSQSSRCKYIEAFSSYEACKQELGSLYGYKQGNFSDIKYNKRQLFTLVQHLLLDKVNGEQVEKSNLTYSVFIECKPVDEVKAQQAAMMLCQAFKKSKGVIDDCSVRGVAGLLMIVLFGNFLERNIVLRLLDVFHIACRKSKECGIHQKKQLVEDFINYCGVVLNLLKNLENRLPFSFSMEEVWNLDSSDSAVYYQLLHMVDCCADELGISSSDLEQARNIPYDLSLSEMLCGIPILSEGQSSPDRQVNPCSSFDRTQCLLSMQLLSSYVCLYNPDRVASDLLSGNVHLPSFLLGSILTYPPLVSYFVSLCREYTSIKNYPVEEKVSEILKLLCSKEELCKPASCEAVSNMGAEESSYVTEQIIMALITENGNSNLDEGLFKNACLRIIKLRGLGQNNVDLYLKLARRFSADPGQYSIDYELLSKVLLSEDNTELTNTSEDSSCSQSLLVQTDLDMKHDGNNNMCDEAERDCPTEDDDIEVGAENLIIDSEAGVGQKSENIGLPHTRLQSNINEVEESKVHDRKSQFDSEFCDQTLDKEKKSQARQLSTLQLHKKRRHCINAAVTIMASTFTVLICVAFTCQMSGKLLIGCIALAMICLSLSIMFCLTAAIDTHELAERNHEETNIQPVLNNSITEIQELDSIVDSCKTTEHRREAVSK